MVASTCTGTGTWPWKSGGLGRGGLARGNDRGSTGNRTGEANGPQQPFGRSRGISQQVCRRVWASRGEPTLHGRAHVLYTVSSLSRRCFIQVLSPLSPLDAQRLRRLQFLLPQAAPLSPSQCWSRPLQPFQSSCTEKNHSRELVTIITLLRDADKHASQEEGDQEGTDWQPELNHGWSALSKQWSTWTHQLH